MDMNGLLSGLADAQSHKDNRRCDCDDRNDGIFGGGIIWIIVLFFLFAGGGWGGQCQDDGIVCGCEPKHCKELCRCGSRNSGFGGFGGFGGGCGGGFGIWWIIIIIVLFASNRNKRCCSDNLSNLDCCEE